MQNRPSFSLRQEPVRVSESALYLASIKRQQSWAILKTSFQILNIETLDSAKSFQIMFFFFVCLFLLTYLISFSLIYLNLFLNVKKMSQYIVAILSYFKYKQPIFLIWVLICSILFLFLLKVEIDSLPPPTFSKWCCAMVTKAVLVTYAASSVATVLRKATIWSEKTPVSVLWKRLSKHTVQCEW